MGSHFYFFYSSNLIMDLLPAAATADEYMDYLYVCGKVLYANAQTDTTAEIW